MAGLPLNEPAYARPLPDGSGSAWNSSLGIFLVSFHFSLIIVYHTREQAGFLVSTALLPVQRHQNGPRRRAVPGTLSNMMELYDSSWVYQNIAPSLADVPFRLPGEAQVYELFEVSPPGAWSPYIPEAGFKHAIGPVKLTFCID